jgi:hypothetical protein
VRPPTTTLDITGFCHVTVGGVAIAEPARTATTLIAAISAHVNLNFNKTYLLKVEPLDFMPLRRVRWPCLLVV